jgi:hypothetical protein
MTGLGAFGKHYDDLCAKLDAVTAGLDQLAVQNDQLHSVAYREWEPFVDRFGGVTDANKNLTVRKRILSNGWEGKVTRISVSVGGASSGATVAIFNGDETSDLNLIDWASGLFGASPARTVSDYNSPPYFRDNEQLSVVITGSADVADNVAVRVEGYRRQA